MFDMTTEQQPISLPPYPLMIMEAIEASNDANGCNKTAIAKHIESAQSVLPPSHSTLLNYHLNQMKQSGQIAMVKNNYVKPDPNAPPKRGRGRPPKPKPKPKPQGDSIHVAILAPSVSPQRSRGRPPKVKDSSSEERVSGRPRGRPPKKAKTESETVIEATAQPNNGERRGGRGKPPKVKPVMVPVA
ncbi:hypothetical protein N665_0313s0056 [Sinapis alba]|nr:hypothetical protein N665_0313s0056 [Sinapis alba]